MQFLPEFFQTRWIYSQEKSKELTDSGKGKHFIGDFLPKDELDKFIEKVSAIKEGRDPGRSLPELNVAAML